MPLKDATLLTGILFSSYSIDISLLQIESLQIVIVASLSVIPTSIYCYYLYSDIPGYGIGKERTFSCYRIGICP